jgi:hypothetical protein
VQEVESERVRGHIATMAKRLTHALAMIDPAPARDKEARRARLVALALDTAQQENQRMLQRKVGWAPGLAGRAQAGQGEGPGGRGSFARPAAAVTSGTYTPSRLAPLAL